MPQAREVTAFIGFYWTFTVPLVGFRHLSRDVDEAARESRTIRYQRERIRRYVKDQNGRLVGEVAFMEVSPDRGTEAIAAPVQEAQALARQQGATILAVEFQAMVGWREHHHLWDALHRWDVPFEAVPPDAVPNDGQLFDPETHFRAWRDLSRELSYQRRQSVEGALADALANVPDGYGRWTEIAETLNAEGVPTVTGQPWTAENVRKAASRREVRQQS
jgi:hypothetical protein